MFQKSSFFPYDLYTFSLFLKDKNPSLFPFFKCIIKKTHVFDVGFYVLEEKIIGPDWDWLIRLTTFQKHYLNRFINRIQYGLAGLNPINKSISMMFLKWGQSDQSVPIGSNYFFLQGPPIFETRPKHVTNL